jgi:hypothetical protein
MLRVPAWKSALWPHEYDLMSSSVGSWRSWRHRGEALGVGMDTGYGLKRQWLLLVVGGIVGGDVGLSCAESVGGDGDCTVGSVVSSVVVAVSDWGASGETGG